MTHLKKPVDMYSAKEVMKRFPDMAYSLSMKEVFQKAVDILYGKDFLIKCDLSKRMQFSCQICNREMNSENAVADHYRSGNHQKNLDKKVREIGEPSYTSRASDFTSNSLRHRLLCSQIKPLGLQMVEEFEKYRHHVYYKCNLCAAHGKLDVMYHHLIGKKHTERYIKSACLLQNSVLTGNEREEIRKQLVKMEGINCEAMKTYYGSEFYPRKWEQEGFKKSTLHHSVKRELESGTSSDSSPVPLRSRSPLSQRSRSIADSPEMSPKRFKHSPGSAGKSRSPVRSPKRPARSPSLSRFRNKSPPQECIEAARALLQPKPRAPPPPSLQQPPLQPPVSASLPKEMKDKDVQKFDLEELMIHMNFIIKTHDMYEGDIKGPDDAKLVIELMLKISEALYSVTRTTLDDSMLKSEQKQQNLKRQKDVLLKIMGHLKYRMEAHWQAKYAS
ncbi:uncharacterized protein LOC122244355 [Penaeus japonicus]|uniref:uncharacterized protein LOC122244355 n=1 Tax=Penaeus japonicus TaxID=27405 RepID=UPI001C70C2A8|nr:uncharacterized protein LOC122244355 [Penaeus japonicus]XP_042858167.1 uncharacterized protein LOC122244355 [Penaeus japonicus]